METLIQDLRFGLRTLWKNRGFTVVAVIALALGIGANSAIFTVVNAVLLRPLPYQQSERLMFLSERSPQIEGMSIAYQNFLDWREQNHIFDQLAVFRRQGYNLTGNDSPEKITGAQVSAELFEALRVKPAYGRVFTREEDKPGAAPVVVLSHGLWSRQFGSNPNIINTNLNLSGKSYTVIGIMPPDYQFPSRVELWTPVGQASDNPGWTRGNHPGLYGVARLKSGVSIEQARAELDTIAIGLEKQYPNTNTNNRITLTSLFEIIVGDVRPALLVLFAAVGAVLLIACANVANLLLARAASRQKEIAIRTAMGATRFRVIRQLLTESVLLALIGGGLGMLLAAWGTKAMLALSANTIPRFREISVDYSVLAFTFLVSIVTGIIFGLVPALQSTKIELTETLKESGRSSAGGVRHQRLRSLLVISEIAVTLVLLIGAGLLIKSFLRLQQVDPGFNAENVLTMDLTLPETKYKEPQEKLNFYQQLLPQLAALPGVETVAAVSELPLESGNQTSFYVEGTPPPNAGEEPLTEYSIVTPDYFSALGLRLMKGRAFTAQDNAQAAKVAIIDENFARRYWSNQDPIGKRVRLGGYSNHKDDEGWVTIVGIVGNVKFEGLDTLDQRVLVYTPYQQTPSSGMTLTLKTKGEPTAYSSAVRQQISAIDKDQPVANIRSMSEVRDNSISSRRFAMLLLGIFAAVALILAAVGIYGVMAYSVTQRTHELGIRMALGAQFGDVLKMIIRQGLILTIIGVVVGLVGAVALTRAMQSLLFGISATDPVTFISVALLLTLIALLACYFPARRAAKVDPMVALRYE